MQQKAFSQNENFETSPIEPKNTLPSSLDIEPQILQNSPTLRQWMRQVPNVLESIENDPSFKPRLSISYTELDNSSHPGGLSIGIEDMPIGQTGLTVSADYTTLFSNRQSGGLNLQHYLLPMGSYVNITPVVGFRSLVDESYNVDGVTIGAKLILALSRNGAADISFSQTFTSPGTVDEAGIWKVKVGYALTSRLRFTADVQQQNTPFNHTRYFSLGWELLVP
jgi:hypothetical protein